MTDPVRPDDRELERYLQGDSALSRRYRAASTETPPPELDAAILAQARSALRRRPRGAQRWLASIALAASVVLGVNLGWNVYQAAPAPGEATQHKSVASENLQQAAQPIAPAAPPPAAERDLAAAGAARSEPRADEAESARVADASRRKAEARERQARVAQEQAAQEQAAAPAEQSQLRKQAAAPPRGDERAAGASADAETPAAAVAAPAAPAPWTETEKIERLIQFVAGLDDVDFIRNGEEHSAEDAAKHMRLKLEKSGKRCRTAEDFIRICASFSSLSGEAYLMRFPDGRTRTAEDVLREQLATMP